MKRVSILSLLLCACATYGPEVDNPPLASEVDLHKVLLEKLGSPVTVPYKCEALQGSVAFGGNKEYRLAPPAGILIGDESECVVSWENGEIQ